MPDIYSELSPEAKETLRYGPGAFIIVTGAGTGDTLIIPTRRIIFLGLSSEGGHVEVVVEGLGPVRIVETLEELLRQGLGV
jgi:glucokinase